MVQSAHETNVVRHHDLQLLWKQFASITKRLKQNTKRNESDETIAKELRLTNEGRALLAGTNWTFDLSLPSIVDTLPHLGHVSSMEPAYLLKPGNRGFVSMTLGIPTVKRGSQSYLEQTLKSIFDNMSEADAGLATNMHFYSVCFFVKDDLPGAQISDPSLGRILFSFVTSSNARLI